MCEWARTAFTSRLWTHDAASNERQLGLPPPPLCSGPLAHVIPAESTSETKKGIPHDWSFESGVEEQNTRLLTKETVQLIGFMSDELIL